MHGTCFASARPSAHFNEPTHTDFGPLLRTAPGVLLCLTPASVLLALKSLQVHVDEDGNPTKKPGKISSSYILKHCPIEVGTLYSTRDAQKTLQNVFALDLFDNVQVR